MSSSISLSFRTSKERAERLERLVRATERPRSWLLDQALDAYLEAQDWQVVHIAQGLEELGRGEGVAHDEVAAWLASWGSEAEREPPGRK